MINHFKRQIEYKSTFQQFLNYFPVEYKSTKLCRDIILYYYEDHIQKISKLIFMFESHSHLIKNFDFIKAFYDSYDILYIDAILKPQIKSCMNYIDNLPLHARYNDDMTLELNETHAKILMTLPSDELISFF